MTKYILIQNEGEIESNSFELIGASTKRNEKDKIGFFGSGLKYSISYMMRKGIDFKIFSGFHEMKFSTMGESLKGQSFERICINGKPTSYTTTMGPTWTEDWFVLREIYCNALDEGTCQLVRETETVSPSEGKTRIYIEQTESLRVVSDKWDHYFADEREPLFSSEEVYTCYLGSTDGSSSQKIDVFRKTEGVLYRRGIRVAHKNDYLYDYGCQFVDINEDRTAKHAVSLSYGITNMFSTFSNESYIKSVLRTGEIEKTSGEYRAISSGDVHSSFSNEWVRFGEDNLLVVKEKSGKYGEEILRSKKEVFLLPLMFARELKQSQPQVIILGMSNIVGKNSFSEVAPTPKITFLISQVTKSLKEMKYEIPFPVKIVDFDNEDVMGQADLKNREIFISIKTFDMGRREIAMTLIEETEHILSQKEDETRAFQTHIFSQWLKTMEEANGLFL
jgi:hypothetical protein